MFDLQTVTIDPLCELVVDLRPKSYPAELEYLIFQPSVNDVLQIRSIITNIDRENLVNGYVLPIEVFKKAIPFRVELYLITCGGVRVFIVNKSNKKVDLHYAWNFIERDI